MWDLSIDADLSERTFRMLAVGREDRFLEGSAGMPTAPTCSSLVANLKRLLVASVASLKGLLRVSHRAGRTADLCWETRFAARARARRKRSLRRIITAELFLDLYGSVAIVRIRTSDGRQIERFRIQAIHEFSSWVRTLGVA
jgi:hypothetical protein